MIAVAVAHGWTASSGRTHSSHTAFLSRPRSPDGTNGLRRKYQDPPHPGADGVATVTINRPESRNAINADMFGELLTIWDDLSRTATSRSSC